jgi:FixJ family two-component response regulator
VTPSTILEPTVYLIDNDSEARKSLEDILASQAIGFVPFDTADRFRSLIKKEPFGCIVVEQHLEGTSGIEFLEKCRLAGWKIPIIVLATRGDIEYCARAFGLGANDYMEKPVQRDRFLSRIRDCFAIANKRKQAEATQNESKKKLDLLTDREREVLNLLVAGNSMKSIASISGTSFQAVARHRQRILDKLGLENDVILTRWVMEQEYLRTCEQ